MQHIPVHFLTDFRELCSHALVLRQIEALFRDGGGFEPDDAIPMPKYLSGERRSLVQQFYHGIDFGDVSDARRFLKVVSLFLAQSDIAEGPKEQLREMCRTAGFVVSGAQVRLSDYISTEWLVGADASFDREHFAVYCERMEASVSLDPSAAIGAAKELVEAVCKYVLRAWGTPAGSNDNISMLSKNAVKALDLSAESIPDAAKGADSMKKVLGSMGAVVQGIAELRNLYGSGHGRDGKLRGVKPRHAKLAVGAATTLSTFLLETLEERQHHPET